MTTAELRAAYVELVGYDPIEDDPSMTHDELLELYNDVHALIYPPAHLPGPAAPVHHRYGALTRRSSR